MSDFPTRLSYREALALALDAARRRRLAGERCATRRAHGRVLAQDIVAGLDVPGFDNSAMDGFALRHADLARAAADGLALCGEQFAGPALGLRIGPGQCARITTGAPMPEGADTVLIKENARVQDGRVFVLEAPAAGRNVRGAGEDIAAGARLIEAGAVLTPSRIALCAMQGLAEVEAVRRPTVAVFTTGDELVEPGLPLRPGELYNSNRELLMGLLRAEGLEPTAWPTLPDVPERVESALRHAGHAFDLVITCGGVSAGEKDHLPALMQEQAEVCFWKVRMKPGMPVLLAEGTRLGPALFLCLPGNPVSVLATWLALGRPLVDGLQGRREPRPRLRARLATAWTKRHERLEFLRGRLHSDDDGVLRVVPNPADGSHRMRAAADSDALIELEEGARAYPADSLVDVLPY